MKNSKIAIAILITLIIVLTGCGRLPPTGMAYHPQITEGGLLKQEPITIGWFGPLTGEVASAGVPNLKGIQLAVDHINEKGGINGRPLELIFEDDQMNSKLSINTYYKMVETDNVNAVLTMNYGAILALSERAAQDKTVVINSIDASEELARAGDYVFAIGLYDEGYALVLEDFTYKDLNKRKVGVIYNNIDPLLELIKETFVEKFEEHGGSVELLESYAPDTTDFRSILMKVKQKNLDTIVVLGADEAGIILKQATELGLDIQFLGWDQFSTPGFMRNAQGTEDGAYLTFWDAPDNEMIENFFVSYQEKFNEEPENLFFSVVGYDATMVLAEAMKTNAKGEGLKDALYKIKDFQGVKGKITIDPDGITREIVESMHQIQGKEIVKV